MLTLTNELTDSVQVATDSLFNLLIPRLTSLFSDALCLKCIKAIDCAEPIIAEGVNTLVFKTPYGYIPPSGLSSGTKSFILIMYRKQHSGLNWIPSIESMGDNAKQFLFDNCDELDFPLYCSVCSARFYDMPCLDITGTVTTVGELLSS